MMLEGDFYNQLWKTFVIEPNFFPSFEAGSWVLL